jgi:nickel and cobalt resistance protein CnrR
MKRILIFFLAVVVVAALSAMCTHRWMHSRPIPSEAAAHQWLHDELHLTSEQLKALEPIEARYAERQRTLTQQLREANRELARVMGEDKRYTPRVAAAVEMIHMRMGELQKASLEHVFEMRTVLTPEQGDKLLRLAQQTLESSR